MPHSRSAEKRLRQNVKRRLHNRAVIKVIKKQIKATLEAAKGGSADQLWQEYKRAAKRLDKAAARGVIHRNTASRRKAQLARLVNSKIA